MANVLLGVTGSVAAIRTPELTRALAEAGHDVKVAATEPALYFFDPADLPAGVLVRDADEWPGDRWRRGDPVLHIELRKWADLLLVAPLDANTLAKLALGQSDNCLTCVARAWDPARPVVLAPAMNTLMWQHPATARHLRQIAEDAGLVAPEFRDQDGLVEWINAQRSALCLVAPVSKTLACGDLGPGAMAEVPDIVAAVEANLPRVV
jgi:phosphopantothenoylcysteine decarboxylase